MFKSAVPLKGPVLIAIYGFTLVLAIAALSDAKVVFLGGISGAPRIARHLWRMAPVSLWRWVPLSPKDSRDSCRAATTFRSLFFFHSLYRLRC